MGTADLKAMTDALSHRGPDDEGQYSDESTGTGLGHRRLSIIDLSPSGHQPMTYRDSRLWIVFNGEIYNFLEIRRELETKGHSFVSDSDTEVILAAYTEWATDCFSLFNGMWAVAIYDEKKGDLFLCRDRYGIKPLYYYTDNRQLIFGSEYKSFLAIAGKIGLKWDARALKTSLISAFQLESSGHTLFENVYNLLPGHYLKINESGIEMSRWWNTLDHLVECPRSLDDQAALFRDLFIDSCRLRLRSDVPVGTSLSGGLDSSSVLAAVSLLGNQRGRAERSAEDWQRTFIHTFDGTALDEKHYADMVADSVGAKKIYVSAEPEDFCRHVDDVLYSFESIYEGMPDSAWRVYQAQRKNGVVVSLDGHGADEALGGYNWYLSSAMENRPVLSRSYWSLLRQQKEMYGTSVPPLFALKAILRSIPLARQAYRWAARSVTVNPLVPDFMSRAARKIEPYPEVISSLPDGFGALNSVLYQDFHHLILPRILKNFDTVSMAHGVEVRMPFMDYRLVNYIFSLPGQSKIGGGYSKLVLRQAMAGLLPEEIRLRKTKIGFNSPLPDWLKGILRPWVEDVLGSESPLRGLIDMGKLGEYYSAKVATGKIGWDEGLTFWKYLNALRLTKIMNGVKGAF